MNELVVTQPTAADRVKTALAKSTTKGTLAGLTSNNVLDVLEGYRSTMEKALPKHLTADRLIAIATTLISSTPGIASCTASSLIGAVIQTSMLGLKPIAALGECYYVPFNKTIKGKEGEQDRYVKEVTFIIGYKGYITLARNSGQVLSIHAEVVYQGDSFDYELGLHTDLRHKRTDDTNEDKMTHAYAVVKFKDGGDAFIVLTKKQVEKLRLRSPGQKAIPSGAWASDYDQMAKAKAIRQLSKYMPIEVDKLHEGVATEEKIIPSFDNLLIDGHTNIDAFQTPEIVESPALIPQVVVEPEPEEVPESEDYKAQRAEFENPAPAKEESFADRKARKASEVKA